MERIGNTNTEFFSSTSHDDVHSGTPLSEPLGSVNGNIEAIDQTSGSNDRIVGMLESVGIPRSTSENVIRALNSPKVRDTRRKVTGYVREHPAQVLGALTAVAALGTGLAVRKSRRKRVTF